MLEGQLKTGAKVHHPATNAFFHVAVVGKNFAVVAPLDGVGNAIILPISELQYPPNSIINNQLAYKSPYNQPAVKKNAPLPQAKKKPGLGTQPSQPPAPFLASMPSPPFTQKARGIWAMLKYAGQLGVLGTIPSGIQLVQEPGDIQKIVLPENPFARPCPEVPAHGFVDSKKIASLEDLKEIFELARQVDPKAQVLVMPAISCFSSGIYIPESGIITIGPDHDGATGGSKEAVTFTIAKSSYTNFLKNEAAVPTKDHSYIEFLNSVEPAPILVQFRGGPPQTGVSEYIPVEMTVKEIMTPNVDDLVEWKKVCDKASQGHDKAWTIKHCKEQGLVVWGPDAPLACHAAVQASVHGIPFLTRPELYIGDKLFPPTVEEVPFDKAEFLKGANYLTPIGKLDGQEAGLKAGIAILHNSIPLRYSKGWSRLLGYGVCQIFRYAAAACLGEMRHYPSEKKKGLSRNQIFNAAGKMQLRELAHELAEKAPRFMHTTWGGSFGGPPWFKAALWAVKVYNRIEKGECEAALSEANELLNFAHNTGWLFNKFFGQDFMNNAASKDRSGPVFMQQNRRIYAVMKADLSANMTFRVRLAPSMQLDAASAKGNAHGGIVTLTVAGSQWKPVHWGEFQPILKTMIEEL